MSITRQIAGAVIAFVVSLPGSDVFAQAYPVKVVRVVIPWPAGGSNDIAGRIVLQKMSDAMGHQFVIDNRPGAAGSIGADVVAKAPADGYTLMVHSTTHVGNQTLYPKLPYHVIKDFAPVALLAAQPGVLAVHPSMPVKTVRQFIDLAKTRPGQILYSSAGNGSAPHLNMTLLASMTGTNLIHVPYKGGPPAVNAIVSGETQAMLATVATVVSQIDAGRLRALGVSSPKRLRNWPDWPAISEAVPGYEMNAWIALFAPAGTPRGIVDRLNAEVARVQQLPEVNKLLAAQGLEPWTTTPEEFGKVMLSDFDKYAKLIRLTGAKID
jgi:tripartite-type tricarboxylate transporter receptor subunit TctC